MAKQGVNDATRQMQGLSVGDRPGGRNNGQRGTRQPQRREQAGGPRGELSFENVSLFLDLKLFYVEVG